MPLLWLSLAFLLGVWLGQALQRPAVVWGGITLAAVFLGVLRSLLVRRFPSIPSLRIRLPNPDDFPASDLSVFLILGALSLGGLRYQMTQPRWEDGFIAQYNDLDAEFVVQGVAVRPVDERDYYTQLTLKSERIRRIDDTAGIPATGLLLVRLPTAGGWRYGDRVEVRGLLKTPPSDETFSYKDYLAHHGVYSYMPYGAAHLLARGQGNRLLAWIYALRERGLTTLYRLFPDPEASLMAGILLGVETNIPAVVAQAFQDSGTSHIIAISGFNMAIVAGLFAALFGRLLGKRNGALTAILAISLYTVLVGASAAVVRSALMSGLSVFSAQVGRRGNGLNTLAIVAAVMAFFNPDVLWDVGFQLSFMATLGLVLYANPLIDGFVKLAERFIPSETAKRVSQPVGEYFLFTFATLLPTLPVMVYTFGRLPLASLLANPLVLPAQPAVMILGGLAMLFGMVVQPLGQLFAYLTWPFIAYTIRIAEFWAQFRGSMVYFDQVSGWALLAFYIVLLGLTFGLPAWRKHLLSIENSEDTAHPGFAERLAAFKEWLPHAAAPFASLVLVGMAIVVVLVWRMAVAAPDGRLHLTILDVGSGDGVLIQTPGGRAVLIDGGGSASALSDALGRRLPLGMRKLDAVVVAGTEDEQLGALPRVLERYPASLVLWSGPSGGTRSARLLREHIAQNQIPLAEAQTGGSLDLGDGARLTIISANQRGAVLLLEWGNFHSLLPVGLDKAALAELQTDPKLVDLTALMLSDGGYAPLNPPKLIDRLHPQLVLLSVAAGDWRNLPDAETLDAVEGYTLLRTDRNGWIHLSTDGDQLWVEVEKREEESTSNDP